MAIVVMLVLLFTAGAGVTLLAGAIARGKSAETAPATNAPATNAPAVAPLVDKKDPFAPPSLVRSRTEPVPWARSLLEFAHPALAIIGVGMWIGFTLIHEKTIGTVAALVLLTAAIVGVSWFTANRRGGKLSFGSRTLVAHAAGAALALALTLVAIAHP